MKKILLFVPMFALFLTGCGSQAGGPSDSPKETVALTAKNFSTYVATNSSAAFNANGRGFYYTFFIGADHCRFIDCEVTYSYSGVDSSSKITVSLSISGDGEAKPFFAENMYSPSTIKIESAKGTVEVYSY